ncbi:uncharacterized protein LY89DRAFT_320509 [Mollisia scopiformis]|uniref:Uncharacterized protein n=1 Tax=Mollisia scopiformis TaxID=149040 RepID=A0A132BBW9_MOLSC|nr:uncharacterized protein LY89DRAFT_320509 [Mollisia scopiformis]KUJ09147.1 hypothetical protein LY89DRAFT_320509 [Mollisia scopiformis]
MIKFHPESMDFPLGKKRFIPEVDEEPLVDACAMDYIWPPLVTTEFEGPIVAQIVQQLNIGANSLDDQAIKILVDNFLTTESSNISLLDKATNIPHFQEILLPTICNRSESEELDNPEALGSLLGIAFTGQQHLDWVLLKELTTDAIAVALNTGNLNDAQSISLCIDTIKGTPAQLIEALSKSKSFCELFFLQEPDRKSDDRSREMFLALAATSHTHLHKCKIMLTGAGLVRFR